MPIHIKNYLSYFSFSSLDNLSIVHGVFMRHGGSSKLPWEGLNMATSVGDSRNNVIENRNRILNCLDLKKDSIFDVWQVHSRKVIISKKPRNINAPHEKADAIITSNPQVSLMMLFADCVPILMYDPENQVCALAHAGWKGTVKNIAGATIEALHKEFSSDPGTIIACIGPSICRKHYEVGRDVVDAAEKAFKENGILGLLPRKKGPRRAHKLTVKVMEFVEDLLEQKPEIKSDVIRQKVKEHFGLSVHKRSIERATDRSKKKQ